MIALGVSAATPVCAAPAAPDSAKGSGAPDGPDRSEFRADLTLLFDAAQARPGDSVRAGVLFALDPGWHVYWQNPGDSGLPSQLKWDAPGAELSDMYWPAPHVFREGTLTTHGYEDQVLLWSDLKIPASASGSYEVAVKADFLACKLQCIPGTVELRRSLALGDPAPADDETRSLFAKYQEELPVSASEAGVQVEPLYSQSAVRPGDKFQVAVAVVPVAGDAKVEPAREAYTAFVPEAIPTLDFEVTGGRAHPSAANGFLITMNGRAFKDAAPAPEQRLRGVLAVRGAAGVRYVNVDLPLARAEAGAPITSSASPEWFVPTQTAAAAGAVAGASAPLSLVRALLLALLGGLILNLMPCVLPVLAIKVVRVAELAHERRSEVLAQGAAYTIGIVSSMAVLAGVVVALRSAGTAVGWGFQFQEPRFIVGISAVLFLFALNLLGVFEIDAQPSGAGRLLQGKSSGWSRSFFEGLLAVVLATPCTAPFLGTAVGFAFAAPPIEIGAIFVAIGLGLAAPFVAVTLVPGWARFIPRAGAWTLYLRSGLGFALLATQVWLLWLLGRAAGVNGMVAMIALMVAVGFLAWLYGISQQSDRPLLSRVSGTLVLLAAIAGVAALPLRAGEGPVVEQTLEIAGEQRFEPAALRAELDSGKPVFAYFTADWCLTCKVNEELVLGTEPVRAELSKLGITTFKGDWTRRDEQIRKELERFGRAGVPMYVVYNPSSPDEPRLLPELLTVDSLVSALRWAAEGAKSTASAPRVTGSGPSS